MPARTVTLATGLLAGGLLAVSAASPALAVCDGYLGGCAELPGVQEVVDTKVGEPAGTAPTRARTGVSPASSPATLPFTGGELVLVSALGAAAVAGGVGLVVAGRRRTA